MTMNTVNNMHPMLVLEADKLTPHILRLTLEPQSIFTHQAGDYLMLGLDHNETKPFSIANAPWDNSLIELHIRNQADSEWMQRLFNIQAGDMLWADGPKPQMKLQSETELNLFIAGGTGIAPIKALIEQRIEEGLTQATKLYWGARQPEDLYIHQQLQTLADNTPNLDYLPVISENPEWAGLKGLVHQVALSENPELEQATVYICGAWPMVQTAKTDFIEAGLPRLKFIH